ncbi:hypothetical protein BMF94_0246 [Rhodotorula taiwanensis]|uniref:Pre-mRNA-splicing factor SYF2 n=1 Tax=Rhodotorula taiwanensis TaxID=741276 RepID=A0A2S5BIT0_9BASI|nr:hypothetical protein BMF94_0246 [Rhodotorula taiwanensis]
MPPRKSTRSAKGKQVEPEPAAAAAPPPPAPEEVEAELTTEQPAATTDMEEQEALQEGSGDAGLDLRERDDAPEAGSSSSSGAAAGVDLSERMNKLKELRKRMGESARANRQDVIAEVNAQRASARTLAKLERKRQQAEAMGEKARAAETGEDLERKKNWEYSIEDNERWDKKLARKERRADYSFTGLTSSTGLSDYDDVTRRKYKKDLDDFKPDLATYNKQREAALQSDALVASATGGEVGPVLDGNGLYRDANSFVYADHKPSEDQVDRMISKLNSDIDKRQKRSRKRDDDDQGDITWINEQNRQFNRKLSRYYDDVTRETRENFERGTAL